MRRVYSRYRDVIRPTFVLVFLAVVLVAMARVAKWFGVEFSSQLFGAFLDLFITAGVASAVALFAWREKVEEALTKKRVERIWEKDGNRHLIQVGKMVIPSMSILFSCGFRIPCSPNVSYEFSAVKERRELSPSVANQRERWLAEAADKAKAKGLIFNNLPKADLLKMTFDMIIDDCGKRVRHCVLEVGETDYYTFATSSLCMDRPIVEEGGKTIRQLFSTEDISPWDVDKLPVPAAMGSATVVVTKDDRVVLGVRTRTFVASAADSSDARHSVHVVGEGLSPADVDASGNFDPRVGAVRGLKEELGIGDRCRDFGECVDIVPTGVVFDHLRCQPLFTYLARIDLTFEELQAAKKSAVDGWEADDLVAVHFDIEYAGARQLLQGSHPDIVGASNHALAALWFAFLFEFGFRKMKAELSL